MGGTPPDKMLSSCRLLVATAVILLPLVSSLPTDSIAPPIEINQKVDGDGYFTSETCDMARQNNNPSAKVLRPLNFAQDNSCEVIIHTRKRGVKNLFVEIGIQHIPSSSLNKLDTTKPVKIVQGSLSIECKQEDSTVVSSDASISIESPVVHFTEDRLYCSFIMKTLTKPKLADAFQIYTKPKLHFFRTGDEEEIIEYKNDDNMWDGGIGRCDPDLANTINVNKEEDGVLSEPVEDLSATTLNCLNRKLYVKPESSGEILVKSVVCDADWKYIVENEEPKILDKDFTATCRTTFCSQCTATTLSPFSCPTCSAPEVLRPTGDDCASITCASSRWILDGSWIMNPILKCAKANSGKYVWTHNEVEVKKGACTTQYDCFVHKKPMLTCHGGPIKGIDCQLPAFSADNRTIMCNPGFVMRWDKSLGSVTSFECNPLTGEFVDSKDKNKAAPTDTPIGCYEPPSLTPDDEEGEGAGKVDEPSNPPSSSSVADALLNSGLISLALLLIVGALAFFALFFLKRRHAAEKVREEMEGGTRRRIGETGTSGQKLRQQSTISFISRIPEVKSSRSGRSTLSGSSSPEESDESSQSIESLRSEGGDNSLLTRTWPRNYNPREPNPDVTIPKVEPYVVTKENMLPAPRNTNNCPELQISVSMEIRNKNLISKDKATTTASKSVVTKEGGVPPASDRSIPETKKSQ